MIIRHFLRLTLPLCSLLFGAQVAAADGDKPLLQEGKKPYSSEYSQRQVVNWAAVQAMIKVPYSQPSAAFMFIKKNRRMAKAGSK